MEYRISFRETSGKKIYLDPEGREGIYLYPGEIRKCRLAEGMVLTDQELEELRREYALPRAKKRALGILVKQDKTLKELADKLEAFCNDSRSIQETLLFVQEAGYVDDYQYARDYLHSRRRRKSYRMIRMELLKKGISPEILDSLFEEERDQNREDVEAAVMKYARRFEKTDRTAQAKICAHFLRKGYDPKLIRTIVRDLCHGDGEE